MITRVWKEATAAWLAGANVTRPTMIALGTGLTPPLESDIGLENEYYRTLINYRFSPKRFVTRFNVLLRRNQPPVPPGTDSITFTEIGLFDGSVVSVANASFENWSGGEPAYWIRRGVGSSWSQSTDKYDATYALELTYGSEPASVTQDLLISEARGKAVTFRVAVKTAVEKCARVGIYDGNSTDYSHYHPGDNKYTILEISKFLRSGAPIARVILEVAKEGSAKFDWIQCFESGKLWARALINQRKTNNADLSLSWDLATEEGIKMYEAYNREEITQGTANPGSLSPEKYSPGGYPVASRVLVTTEDNNIRYWLDGGTPSASSGHLLESPGTLTIDGLKNVSNLRFIAVGGTAKLKITYFR